MASAYESKVDTPLIEFCAHHLARYKLPRTVVFVAEMVRSPSGKADYRWAKRTALERLGVQQS